MIPTIQIILIISLFLIFYTYFGYPFLLLIIEKFSFLKNILPQPKNRIKSNIKNDNATDFPEVTVLISAFGEKKETIKRKINNLLELNYPKSKLNAIFAFALEDSQEVDESLMEYYDHFLKEPNISGVSPKDEEIYIKFYKYDITLSKSDPESLAEFEKDINSENFSSEDLTPNSKEKIDSFFNSFDSKNEINIIITKDIKRKGKLSQILRSLEFAKGEIVVFSDANTIFNSDSILNLVRHFKDESVGCVAGEKRVIGSTDSTSGIGEGLYWRYESLLKKLDSNAGTAIGAAGEIFAVRLNLCKKYIIKDVIIEDFILSLNLAKYGYRVVYEPEAYSIEEPTKNLSLEYKRKRRIIAGGFQSILMFLELFNIFKYRFLTIQYFSHRVLRWAVTPFLFALILILNLYLFNYSYFYQILFGLQILFYFLVFISYIFEKLNIKIRIFQIILFFFVANLAAYSGLFRYLFNQQSLTWEKVR